MRYKPERRPSIHSQHFENIHNTSSKDKSSPEKSFNSSDDKSIYKTLPSYNNESISSNNNSNYSHTTSSVEIPNGDRHSSFLAIIIALIAIIGATILYLNIPPTTQKICSYSDLQSQFPNETEDVWQKLFIGHQNILNHKNARSSIYLFLHSDKNYVTKLVTNIAKRTSSCFGKGMKPVELSKDVFNVDGDYGEIIEQFKVKIKESSIVIIANLNEIPANGARALHVICDTFSPIQKDIVVYLTLVPSFTQGNSKTIAVDTLASLWGSKLEPTVLDPIVTRVTDEIIKLTG